MFNSKSKGYNYPAKSKSPMKPKGSKKSIALTRALMQPSINKFMKGK